jgi:hypothetical protein
MRLLKLGSDDRFTLKWFSEENVPPYAILSHTWFRGQNEEVTFEVITECIQDKRPGFRKLEFCCKQAKADDLSYFWVDTCCIDKSNQTELTTSINAMFSWYQNAAKCYVYLPDVLYHTKDTQLESNAWELDFRKSAWFTRGWTLQELLAPHNVEFYSQDGIWLGDKKSLEQQIVDITGISVGALRGQSLSDFRVMERFNWVQNRRTTEKEDKAYCLFGIFDVSIPLSYGEGEASALSRLHEEIQRSAARKFRFSLMVIFQYRIIPSVRRPKFSLICYVDCM